MKPVQSALLSLMALALTACGAEKTTQDMTVATVDAARILAADQEPQNWLSHGRTYDEQRYSPLDQITDKNVGDLGLAWHYDFDTHRGLEATPIVVDGVMYVTGSWSRVYALDAVTGDLLWEYDPEVPGEWAVNACCDVVNRGVAVWQGKVYSGTLDGRLIALDATTGKPVWDVLTIDRKYPYSITGAPRIVKGKVIIGNGGAEFGVRGYVGAYDALTGERVWRFYTVPGNPADGFESPAMAEAAKTWTGEWWKLGGGGTVWDSLAYDAELDLLYVGTGNGSPWNQALRSPDGGDNLFLSSIVAVRPDTGEYVWHYQTTPGEMWDYTATQHMVLVDVEIDGRMRKTLMQAPKNGFFYVLDRETGELISGKNYVAINWASHIDTKTGRPVEDPRARYYQNPWLAFPNPLGGHNWHPMSYNPEERIMYIPAQEVPFLYAPDKDFKAIRPGINLGIDMAAASMPDDKEAKDQIMSMIKGHISAWDPVAQKELWRVQHPGPWNGGLLNTKGKLLFQGNAAGYFVAYDARNGAKLWSFPAQTGIVASPVTYSVDGEQYVAILAGWGGVFPLLAGEAALKSGKVSNNSRILTFKLGGRDSLPDWKYVEPELPAPPPMTNDPRQVSAGNALYHRFCSSCHGDKAVSGGVLPDLRYSTALQNEVWFDITEDGILKENGMVSFKDQLSGAQLEDIRQYVIERAHYLKKVSGKTDPLSQ
tara:strand:- start:1568 stop:3694 length:2127 start_codon:yes stop_codon:yes gene_type:complete